jgi:hypothetical protein
MCQLEEKQHIAYRTYDIISRMPDMRIVESPWLRNKGIVRLGIAQRDIRKLQIKEVCLTKRNCVGHAKQFRVAKSVELL